MIVYFHNSLNNKLYEYEAIIEQLFSEKKLFDERSGRVDYWNYTT